MSSACLEGGLLAPSVACRVLCLGNELLADDAFGHLVAQRIREPGTEVVCTAETGLNLLDHILGVSRLAVVDTIMSCVAPVGTVYVLHEEDIGMPPGGSPHYTGLLETLHLGRQLNLPVPGNVAIIAVEAADCLTVGGDMHATVRAAVLMVVDLIHWFLNPLAQGRIVRELPSGVWQARRTDAWAVSC